MRRGLTVLMSGKRRIGRRSCGRDWSFTWPFLIDYTKVCSRVRDRWKSGTTYCQCFATGCQSSPPTAVTCHGLTVPGEDFSGSHGERSKAATAVAWKDVLRGVVLMAETKLGNRPATELRARCHSEWQRSERFQNLPPCDTTCHITPGKPWPALCDSRGRPENRASTATRRPLRSRASFWRAVLNRLPTAADDIQQHAVASWGLLPVGFIDHAKQSQSVIGGVSARYIAQSAVKNFSTSRFLNGKQMTGGYNRGQSLLNFSNDLLKPR